MTVDDIRRDRERREAAAQAIADTLPPGAYHASGTAVVNSGTREAVAECATHWDACLIMLRTRKP